MYRNPYKFLIQDNIGLAGVPCTNGSAAIPDWIPQFDATVATRIMDAGAIITGKSGQLESGAYSAHCNGGVENALADR